ncbi:MAG: hypothetical protein Q9173_005608 [Seirophora scorigena]
MRATVKISSLKALGITDWPYPVGCDFTDQPHKWHVGVKTEVYCQLLAALANDILAHKDAPTPDFEWPSSVPGQKRRLTGSNKDYHHLSMITFGMLERLTQPRYIGYGQASIFQKWSQLGYSSSPRFESECHYASSYSQQISLLDAITYYAVNTSFSSNTWIAFIRVTLWVQQHPLPKTTHNDSMDCHTPRNKHREMLIYFGNTRHQSTEHDDSNEMANSDSERSRFGNLSVEVMHLICDQLQRPRSLRSPMLVSEKFYSVAVTHLYHCLEWGVLPTDKSRPLDQKLLNMLDPLNQGLRFRSKSWHDLPSQVYQTLLRNQRSLKELELNCTDTSIEMLQHDGDTHPIDRLEVIKRLRIMPCPGEGTPRVACRLFKQHVEIEDLILDLWHMPQHNEDDADLHWLDSSATLLRELFTGVEHSCRHLRKIELSSVNLHNSHQHLVPALQSNSLVKLKFVKCRHPEHFLRALTRGGEHKLLSLKGFAIYHSRAWKPPGNTSESNSLVTAISDFLLHSSNSMRTLWICLRGYGELPDTASIAQHGSTLQWLFLDVRKKKGPWAPRYGYGEWRQLCRSLTAVRQIDTTYPPIVADCHNDEYSQFSLYISATVNIPTIKTVGVNNWPFPTGTLSMPLPGDVVNRDVYRLALATLAHDIVKLREVDDPHGVISRTSETRTSYLGNCSLTKGLSVVVFGMSEELTYHTQPGYGLSPGAFVKSLVQLWDGEYRMRMELVDPQALNKESPYRWKSYDIDRMTYDVGNLEFRD